MASNSCGSLTQDSDEIKEMYCEECDRHGDGYATAVAFCVDCLDYICVTCQRYHKRQFKTHKIQESKGMPQDFYCEKCSTHPGQLIKFYCLQCNKEACQECKDNDHVNCSDVNHLPTLASDIQKCDELTNFSKNMDQLSKNIKDTENILDAKSEVIKKQEENAIFACKEQSNNLIATYKQHRQDLIDDFDKKMEETIARLKKERLELIQKLSEKERNFEKKVRTAETNMTQEVVKTNTNFKELKFEHLNLVGNLKALIVDIEQGQN
ncbi:E3 ubiquitin-protein ligase TRIM56-like [Ruditapes philippinarum]|uniref:E3 ubiquitin-protein ligase TRIM56-like n=1 Tax=Ruditapes philippinarum TaxID=129788 RepID=UPI00295A87F1|nr:E3 ubiquitin-protein ligase TRIM56-like [Ruditapes philippinarum]